MAEIVASLVKRLRDATSAGIMDCKRALKESDGDIELAKDWLRKKGLKDARKRSQKLAAEGIVFSYIHPGDRIGVILELNCETDFVARGDDFRNLAKKLAMHIAWSNPLWLDVESVPQEIIERETEIIKSQLSGERQNETILDELKRFYQGNCLLEQIDIQEDGDKKTIAKVISEVGAKTGENIKLRRFQRIEVGEGIEKRKIDYAREVAEAASSVQSA